MSTAKKLRKASRDGRLSVWVAERTPESKRVVVRGTYGYNRNMSMNEPGGDPSGEVGRIAVMWDPDRWSLYRDGASVVDGPVTKAEAITWCLDGTLPKPVDGPVDLG